MSLGSSLLATLANSGTAGVVLAVTACLAAVSMGGGFAGALAVAAESGTVRRSTVALTLATTVALYVLWFVSA